MKKEIEETARKVWLFGLGTLSAMEDETKTVIHGLKIKGEAVRTKAENTVKETYEEVVSKALEVQEEIQQKVILSVGEVINHAGIPSQTQLKEISSRIDELTKKVNRLHQNISKSKSKK